MENEAVAPHIWLHANLINLFRWAQVVECYQDISSVTKEKMQDENSAVYKAMEFSGLDLIDFSFIEKIYAIFDDWLNKGELLEPLNDLALIENLEGNIEAIGLVELYLRTECPEVDEKGFGMSLVIVAFGNALALNKTLMKIKDAGLDMNNEFKESFKTIAAISSVVRSLGQPNEQQNMGLLRPQIDRCIRAIYQGQPQLKNISSVEPPQ